MKQIDEEVENVAFDTPIEQDIEEPKEQMLISASGGAAIARQLKIPEIQMELDRAVWQVERAISTEREREAKKDKERAKSTQDVSKQQR